MKKLTWENLVTAEDKVRGFEVSVLPENAEIVSIIKEILENDKNDIPQPFQLSVFYGPGICYRTLDTVKKVTQWLDAETVKAVRCELRHGAAILVEMEEFFN